MLFRISDDSFSLCDGIKQTTTVGDVRSYDFRGWLTWNDEKVNFNAQLYTDVALHGKAICYAVGEGEAFTPTNLFIVELPLCN